MTAMNQESRELLLCPSLSDGGNHTERELHHPNTDVMTDIIKNVPFIKHCFIEEMFQYHLFSPDIQSDNYALCIGWFLVFIQSVYIYPVHGFFHFVCNVVQNSVNVGLISISSILQPMKLVWLQPHTYKGKCWRLPSVQFNSAKRRSTGQSSKYEL